MASPEQHPLPLLFLIGDTGGGHRSAAAAVQQALDGAAPGRFETVTCDALRGPDVFWLQRWWSGLYGPCIRLTPWLWWSFWRSSQSPRMLYLARHTLMGAVYGSVARAIQASQPALIVVFHPMTTDPAVRARNRGGVGAQVVTVITDLVTAHLSWRDAPVDRVVVPSAAVADSFARDGVPPERYVPLGLPVAAEFCRPPLNGAERADLKRQLGARGKFLVVLTGGAEGSGGLHRRATAILRHCEDVDVAVICGRNRSLRRRLGKLAARAGDGRLTVHGFIDNMADWLRCADVVVGKAGPGTIAEATCCGVPLVLTSYVRGQEKGNIKFVTDAGAGLYEPRPRQLAAEIGRLRRDPAALQAMRDASAGAGRPRAATDIARLIADLLGPAAETAAAETAAEAGGWPDENALLPALVAARPQPKKIFSFSRTNAADS
jgi:1,2-diacylglycerol 3-beta-galactosyltransferase